MSAFDKLDAAMDAFETRKAAEKVVADEKQLASDRFVAEFSNFRTLVAHPVLEEIGNRLRQRGHEFKVDMNERESGTRSKTLSITLHVFPSTAASQAHGFGARTEHPQVTISGDSHSHKVHFAGVIVYPTGGMQSGGQGPAITLKEATADYVRDKAVEIIAASFKPQR